MPALIRNLTAAGFTQIVVVDDGSDDACAPLFTGIAHVEQCHLLRHGQNRGKGRALKSGIEYCVRHFSATPGVVTCDADGQHRAEDIVRVAAVLRGNPGTLVLGVRDFDGTVPLRSRVGNYVTKVVFFVLTGLFVADTQTGLRGIPASFMPFLTRLAGEGYEYEMHMLAAAKVNCIPIVEEKITTVYIDHNRSSHFRPVFDSMKIYIILLRFFLNTLCTRFKR